MKYILFDFDGTLADSTHLYMNVWNQLAERYNFKPVTKDDLLSTRNLTIQERARQYNFPMHKLPVILPQIYRYFKEHVSEVKLFEGIKEILDELARSGYVIGIVSSNAKENIEMLLHQEQIVSVSEVMSSSRIFGKDTVIKKFMKKHNAAPDQLLYVGDEVRDIIACNKVAVPFMWVSWGLDGFELIEKEKPKYVAHAPKEILDALL
ncbi:HAD hydrolase-like protein [Planomicrobium sp. CPCC 101079]|uniref:HAD hydrolase-like protein n=1 Tax=Planomicrobium sp. CPCC 101079 TaxID=2599618 RepID=UPI0011B72C2B|nr:HAD hydrolase-like protein [Planomicrobium sp. CPCC 101079]TWT09282.1 HAD family hydrolase [Planomicrobium sp. CPCC 101079]